MRVFATIFAAGLGFLTLAAQTDLQAQGAGATHALVLHGDPKYGPDFSHFDYVNPDAPKGGDVILAAIGTYDSLNPYILRGVAAGGLSLTFDTLLTGSSDEAFAEYGLIAETISVAPDHRSVTFTLRPEARFHDGKPITAEDVVWTFDTLKTKGAPFFRAYYADVLKAEAQGPHTVRFSFGDIVNMELPLIIGQMPVLPKHFFADKEFDRGSLEPITGSGPYRVANADPGRAITYERVADYWGKDLPVNRGRHNFGSIRFDYYRDATVGIEALKAGAYDFRQENNAKEWATAYDFPALQQGMVVKEEIEHSLPTGMQGFVMNTRKPIFQDPRVRQALNYGFDFEWSNETLFFGAYKRTESYFSNSELASSGLPTGEELAILERFRGKVPEQVFTSEYKAPTTDGSGNNRANLRTALELLQAAGWKVEKGRLVNAQGQPFEFEILLNSPAFERVALPYAKGLERLGIRASVRTVDTAQYQNRMDNYDFDMTVGLWGQSLSPGNEQRDFWGAAKGKEPGSRNLAGIDDPVVEQLIDLVIQAPDRDSLITRTKALDRVLLWGHYVVPHWHIQSFRVVYWNKFSHPEVTPKYALGFLDTWWVDPDKAEKVAAFRRSRN
ncbi:MAG: extracellular solute-binding protein [Alphaproteobacteria bacterium]|nr:extracellular solute-binding protein [Alphaproteobacteria bacterium]